MVARYWSGIYVDGHHAHLYDNKVYISAEDCLEKPKAKVIKQMEKCWCFDVTGESFSTNKSELSG